MGGNNRPLTTALWLLALLVLGAPASAHLPVAVGGEPLPTLAPMLERTTPAVVNIATVGHVRLRQNPLFSDPFFRRFFELPDRPLRRPTQSLGSGVVVDAERGYVITNHHVIANADRIRVMLSDGRQFDAELIGSDPDSDIAVIRIPAQRLTALPLADSDRLRVGDFVVAIGNPFGLGQTVTSGIVSALGRSGLGIEGLEDFIQTDASINPGNSGGALVNLRGELVGINTAIIAPGGGNVGIGFAIPVNMARAIMTQLIEHGEVRRGRLGILVQDLTPELAEAFGLPAERRGTVIADVVENSPAHRAGLRPGDILLAINDRAIEDTADVRNRIGLLRVGDEVRIEVLRNGKRRTFTARIEAPRVSTLDGARIDRRLAGAVLAEIEPGLTDPATAGVVVQSVEPGSPAARAGLLPGDRLVSLNRRPIRRLEDLEQVPRRPNGTLLLNIQRGDGAFFLVIR
ncbi:DegQ family serine endoprotease [Thiohalobacter sp.]|uniref:DegQ family serine endoprotease n=1 Tax=Thiohalobacter sp. TaxID=2025948 RepID=UPI002605B8B6|nr:DegQ family serine endoprotease [Thiohalobacter sp.]